MKCNKCHEEMKLKEIEVGKDSAGNPVYNLYAFCYHCKTKVNIDKLKKAAKERKEAEQLADAKREAAQREEASRSAATKDTTAPVHVSARTQEIPSQSAISRASSSTSSDRPKKKSAPKSEKASSPKKNLMLPAPARLKSLQRSVTVRMTLILMMTITTTFNRIK